MPIRTVSPVTEVQQDDPLALESLDAPAPAIGLPDASVRKTAVGTVASGHVVVQSGAIATSIQKPG